MELQKGLNAQAGTSSFMLKAAPNVDTTETREVACGIYVNKPENLEAPFLLKLLHIRISCKCPVCAPTLIDGSFER